MKRALVRDLRHLDGSAMVTATEVADLLGVKARTVWRMIAREEFPDATYRANRKLVRWHLGTVREWIERQKVRVAG